MLGVDQQGNGNKRGADLIVNDKFGLRLIAVNGISDWAHFQVMPNKGINK